ncbi:MAG: mechanosensitive ion channel family protein [Desulfovibrionales bacterium]
MNLLDLRQGRQLFEQIQSWIAQKIFVQESIVQIGLLVAVLLVSRLIARPVQTALRARLRRFTQSTHLFGNFVKQSIRVIPFLLALFTLSLVIVGAESIGYPSLLLRPFISLLIAWILIRLVSSIILERFWAKLIAITAWFLAALSIFHLLEPTLKILDSFGVTISEIHLTALTILKATFLLLLLLKISSWAGDLFNHRLKNISDITPSTYVLLSKMFKLLLLVLVILVALSSVGIDLTALAVFSGAVGVGIGFGLQKVASNLISGFILLLDRSIKPGDVIQIGDVYGWISNLQARFVSVVTRDGTEYLIPNEDLITQQVINWSYSNKKIRIKLPIGISYSSDPRLARSLILEATEGLDRVLADPRPVCLMTGFGDSSVDLELRFWINDPEEGLTNIQSEILFRVWDKFQENGISIPFPQRDVHLDIQPSSGPLIISGAREPGSGSQGD